MEPIYAEMRNRLERGETFCLVVVARSDGSTPRKAGAKMLVAPDRPVYATVGGGASEAAAIQAARAALESGVSRELSFDLAQDDVDDADPICGGAGTMLICVVDSRQKPAIDALCAAREAGRDPYIVIQLDAGSLCLFAADAANDAITAPLGATISDAQRKRITGLCGFAHDFEGHDELGTWYCERLRREGSLYLFGGGHVSLATEQVARIAGFSPIVIDDREEYANPGRFPSAPCIVMPEYAALDELPITVDDYLVIATRGHSFDRVCLDWALTTPAAYIGMIGSSRKVSLILERLREQGTPADRLAAIHAPIGLPIGGNAPGEIAVSIVAQLVEERVRRYGE